MSVLNEGRMEMEISVLKAENNRKTQALLDCKNALRNRQGFDLGKLRKTIDDALTQEEAPRA